MDSPLPFLFQVFLVRRHAQVDSASDIVYKRTKIIEYKNTSIKRKEESGVEFRHYSTRNATRIRRKVGAEVLTLGSRCLPCCVRDTTLS